MANAAHPNHHRPFARRLRVAISRLGYRILWCSLAAVTLVPAFGQEPVTLGERLYLGQCAMCHGARGEGGRGPVLAKPKLLHATDDASLNRIIRSGIPGTGMPGTGLIDAEILAVAAHVRQLGAVRPEPVAGDARAGSEVFFGRGRCVACHVLQGKGGIFGPELDGIGARRSPTHLRQSLVDPAADFPPNYAWVEAVTPTGRRIQGLRVNEDTFSIQLRDLGGQLHSHWKQELTSLRKDLKRSPMPSYRDTLTATELTNLVAYLASLQESQ